MFSLISCNRKRWVALACFSLLSFSAFAQTYLGSWKSPQNWGFRAIHMTLLKTGDVLAWNNGDMAETPDCWVIPKGSSYDYTGSGKVQVSNITTNIFCSGHTTLPDEAGTVFVAGGHNHLYQTGDGLNHINLFDPVNATWTRLNNMAYSRWYPGVVMTPDGDPFVFNGTYVETDPDIQTLPRPIPETWGYRAPFLSNPAGGLSRRAPSARAWLDQYYPFVYVDPLNPGKLVYTPHGTDYAFPRYLDLRTLSWDEQSAVSTGVVGGTYPSCTMLIDATGTTLKRRIVKSGGGDLVTEGSNQVLYAVDKSRTLNSSEEQGPSFISKDDLSSNWTGVPSSGTTCTLPMNHKRMHHYLLTLPNGKVLAIGGNQMGFFGNAIFTPEWIDPYATSPAWTDLEPVPDNLVERIARGYHFTAILTPDATVLIAGSEPDAAGPKQSQIFEPPYGNDSSWRSKRPTWIDNTDINESVKFGGTLSVSASAYSGRSISHAMLITLPSVTHAFSINQVAVKLTVASSGTARTVTLPSAPTVCPPGWYMLFLVDDHGVPSTAKIIRIWDGCRRAFVKSVDGDTTSSDRARELLLSDGGQTANGEAGYGYYSSGLVVSSPTVIKATIRYANDTALPISAARIRIEGRAVLQSGTMPSMTVEVNKPDESGTWTSVGTITFTSSDARSDLSVNPSVMNGVVVSREYKVRLTITPATGTSPTIYLDHLEGAEK